MERVTEPVPATISQPSAADHSFASTSQSAPGTRDAVRLQFKPEIEQEQSGVLKAFILLNAYIHPVEVDTSIQENVLSTALGLAKRFGNTRSLHHNEETAAGTIWQNTELSMSIAQSRIAGARHALESATDQTFKFHGTNLRKKQRDALAGKYGQLGELAVRHRKDLIRDMKTLTADLLGKQMDIGDRQAHLRIKTKVDVVKLDTDLLGNQVRQECIQVERNTIAEELAALRKAQHAADVETSASGSVVVPATMPEPMPPSGGRTMLEWETQLSAAAGTLEKLREKLASHIQTYRNAENNYRVANDIIGDTLKALNEKRVLLEQLQQRESNRSTEFRSLFAQLNPLRESINIATERIKKDPAVTKLISEEALCRVLARHINQRDHALLARSFFVGKSGTYASMRVFLRALVEVHQDATERFADMMHAPSIADFEAARQAREASGERIRDVNFQHAEPVGWAFRADGPKRDTRHQSTTSTYSIGWYGTAGPLIAHLYPSTGNQKSKPASKHSPF